MVVLPNKHTTLSVVWDFVLASHSRRTCVSVLERFHMFKTRHASFWKYLKADSHTTAQCCLLLSYWTLLHLFHSFITASTDAAEAGSRYGGIYAMAGRAGLLPWMLVADRRRRRLQLSFSADNALVGQPGTSWPSKMAPIRGRTGLSRDHPRRRA